MMKFSEVQPAVAIVCLSFMAIAGLTAGATPENIDNAEAREFLRAIAAAEDDGPDADINVRLRSLYLSRDPLPILDKNCDGDVHVEAQEAGLSLGSLGLPREVRGATAGSKHERSSNCAHSSVSECSGSCDADEHELMKIVAVGDDEEDFSTVLGDVAALLRAPLLLTFTGALSIRRAEQLQRLLGQASLSRVANSLKDPPIVQVHANFGDDIHTPPPRVPFSKVLQYMRCPIPLGTPLQKLRRTVAEIGVIELSSAIASTPTPGSLHFSNDFWWHALGLADHKFAASEGFSLLAKELTILSSLFHDCDDHDGHRSKRCLLGKGVAELVLEPAGFGGAFEPVIDHLFVHQLQSERRIVLRPTSFVSADDANLAHTGDVLAGQAVPDLQIESIQRPGTVLYVPPGWSIATMSLGPVMALHLDIQ